MADRVDANPEQAESARQRESARLNSRGGAPERSMSDQYYSAIQEQWSNIRGLYVAYGRKRPIMLYDIHDSKIYAYPYKEFKAELIIEGIERKLPSVSGHRLQVDIC